MATLNVIRRWALREQMSIREIARRTGLSRNTVKKYPRAGDEEPRYAKRTSSSKLDPYAEKLATWLAIEATKSRKQRRNLRQIHTSSIQICINVGRYVLHCTCSPVCACWQIALLCRIPMEFINFDSNSLLAQELSTIKHDAGVKFIA